MITLDDIDLERVGEHEAAHAVGLAVCEFEFERVDLDRWRELGVAGRVTMGLDTPTREGRRVRLAACGRVGAMMTLNARWSDPVNDHDRDVVAMLAPRGWSPWVWASMVDDTAVDLVRLRRFAKAWPRVTRALLDHDSLTFEEVERMV